MTQVVIAFILLTLFITAAAIENKNDEGEGWSGNRPYIYQSAPQCTSNCNCFICGITLAEPETKVYGIRLANWISGEYQFIKDGLSFVGKYWQVNYLYDYLKQDADFNLDNFHDIT